MADRNTKNAGTYTRVGKVTLYILLVLAVVLFAWAAWTKNVKLIIYSVVVALVIGGAIKKFNSFKNHWIRAVIVMIICFVLVALCCFVDTRPKYKWAALAISTAVTVLSVKPVKLLNPKRKPEGLLIFIGDCHNAWNMTIETAAVIENQLASSDWKIRRIVLDTSMGRYCQKAISLLEQHAENNRVLAVCFMVGDNTRRFEILHLIGAFKNPQASANLRNAQKIIVGPFCGPQHIHIDYQPAYGPLVQMFTDISRDQGTQMIPLPSSYNPHEVLSKDNRTQYLLATLFSIMEILPEADPRTRHTLTVYKVGVLFTGTSWMDVEKKDEEEV